MGPFQQRDERILRQLLGPGGVRGTPSEELPDRAAIPLEQGLERLARTAARLHDEMLVCHRLYDGSVLTRGKVPWEMGAKDARLRTQ